MTNISANGPALYPAKLEAPVAGKLLSPKICGEAQAFTLLGRNGVMYPDPTNHCGLARVPWRPAPTPLPGERLSPPVTGTEKGKASVLENTGVL